ncbi:hypothetical protein DL96DRAFT_1609712 [Flagelloscypha sp. PMI_526]|nr:hypothetical protein DL96DRAFT_1609712 [Flagelloscypha sp. PMI_526]
MSSLDLCSFSDLPAEIQGNIFHLAAYTATSGELAALLRVSKVIQPWVEDILYDTVYLTKAQQLESISLLIENHPGLLAQKTRKLNLTTGDRSALALKLISELRGLRAASVYVAHREQDVLECLGHFPLLTTLMLDSAYNTISPTFTKIMSSYPFTVTITHLAVASWNNGPHPHFLLCFPHLTHFAATCYESPKTDWIDIWTRSLPSSLRVFAILDQWSDRDTSDLTQAFRKHRRTIPVVLVRMPYTWDVETIWVHISEMWLGAEKLSVAQGVVDELDHDLIELENWYVVIMSPLCCGEHKHDIILRWT